MAGAASGLLSGTPTGSESLLVPFCWIAARARALSEDTSLPPRNQGRLASVILTSTILAVQAGDSIVSSAGGPPTAKIFLLKLTVTVPLRVPPIWSLNRGVTPGSPAYLRACPSIAAFAAV